MTKKSSRILPSSTSLAAAPGADCSTCDSIESCCRGSRLCEGAVQQMGAPHEGQQLLLLVFPDGGIAYDRARDGP